MSYLDYKEAEERIVKYYENKRVIQVKRLHVEKLFKRLETVEKECGNINTDFQLNSDLRGIQYDRVITDGGQMPCSDMDRQIEIIFDRLDREKEQLQNEIYLNNILIRKMEWENDCMEEVLSLLDKESGSLIELKYSQKLSCEKIAERFSMSASNVSKKLKEVKRALIKWIRYYNYQKNGNVFS